MGRVANSDGKLVKADRRHGFTALELVLTYHYRVAVRGLGLPEIKLRLVPGGSGTQGVPRAVGPELAIKTIAGGSEFDLSGGSARHWQKSCVITLLTHDKREKRRYFCCKSRRVGE